MLIAARSSIEWIDRIEYQQQKLHNDALKKMHPQNECDYTKMIYKRLHEISPKIQKETVDRSLNSSSCDDFKTQILVGDSIINETSFFQENKSFPNDNDEIPEPRFIHNYAIDAFSLVDSCKGFLCTNAINMRNASSNNLKNRIVGVYCVRWRRAGNSSENETKLIVNCIDIVEAPLNLHCYLDEKMYVKVPMTLTISLRNTTNSTLHLKTYLKNADNFMFAGHSQVKMFINCR